MAISCRRFTARESSARVFVLFRRTALLVYMTTSAPGSRRTWAQPTSTTHSSRAKKTANGPKIAAREAVGDASPNVSVNATTIAIMTGATYAVVRHDRRAGRASFLSSSREALWSRISC